MTLTGGRRLLDGDRRALFFILIWLLLATVFIAAHFRFFFLDLHSELGDFAANALQIFNAKHFRELYGNYSRWGFHHPGPGFFYAYALGEWVFCDLLKLIPSPVNAHMVTGILLQTGMFVWTVALIQKHCVSWAVVPPLLVLAALHFGAVNYRPIQDSAFESIWPPHVLLFPFVCCLVAGASVAAGAAEDILPLVLSACLLVHGHVAQPLFVLPFVTVAIIGFTLYHRKQGISFRRGIARHPARVAIAGGVLFLAVLPLVLDLLRGQESNFRTILGYFTTQAGDRKSLAQSVLYLICFACYAPNPQEYCTTLGPESLRFLKENAIWLVAWLFVGAAALLALKGLRQRLFFKWLYLYLLLALGLTLIWGTLQAGPLYAFNSYFNYGILFLVAALPVVGVTLSFRAMRLRSIVAALIVVAFPLFYATAKSWHFDADLPHSNVAFFPDLRAAAATGPRIKYLLFPNDYWTAAASVAVELERAGYEYAVPPEQGLEFDRRHTQTRAEAATRDDIAFWRIGPTSSDDDPSRSLVIGPNALVTFLPPRIDPSHSEITFRGPTVTAAAFCVTGWSLSDGPFSWSEQKTATLHFQASAAPTDVELLLDVFPGTFEKVPSQRIAVRFRGISVGAWTLGQPAILPVRIPVALWNRPGPARVTFEFPDAISPRALGISDDARTVGYGFRAISFRLASP